MLLQGKFRIEFDGKKYCGNLYELARQTGVEFGYIKQAIYNRSKSLRRKKFRFVGEGTEEEAFRKDYLIAKYHILEYGNTIVYENADKYVEEFLKEGIKVSAEHYEGGNGLKEGYLLKGEWYATKQK